MKPKPLTNNDVVTAQEVYESQEEEDIYVCETDDVLSALEGLKQDAEKDDNKITPGSYLVLRKLLDKWFPVGKKE